jgi:RHS repeat-associated protein
LSRIHGENASRKIFQLDNHLGTACVEVDESGAVISYEEYHPYGTSAYRAEGGDVSRKRYRYNGKERDEETSLYYYGARYYAPWLGKCTAADPAGLVDGVGLYNYCRGSPVALRDPNGTQSYGMGNVRQREAEIAQRERAEAKRSRMGSNDPHVQARAARVRELNRQGIFVRSYADPAKQEAAIAKGEAKLSQLARQKEAPAERGSPGKELSSAETPPLWERMLHGVVAGFGTGMLGGGEATAPTTPEEAAAAPTAPSELSKIKDSAVAAAIWRLPKLTKGKPAAPERGRPGPGAGRPSTTMGSETAETAGAAIRAETTTTATVDDILKGATPGRATKGRTTQFEKSGGLAQANKDFDALGVSNVRSLHGGGRIGTLPDGRTVIVRPSSSAGGRPTLEIQRGQARIKVRFGD